MMSPPPCPSLAACKVVAVPSAANTLCLWHPSLTSMWVRVSKPKQTPAHLSSFGVLIAAILLGNIGCSSVMFPHCTGWLRLPTRPPAPRPPCWKHPLLVHFPSVLPPQLQTTLVPLLPSCTNSVMPPMSLRAQLPSRLLQLTMTLRLTLAALSHRRALRLSRTS